MRHSCVIRYASIAGLVLLAAGSWPCAPAHAEDYASMVRAAVEEYAQGNWDEAFALFHRAHAIEPSARTFRGLGLAAFEMRRYADAIRFMAAALADRRKALTAEQKEVIEQLTARAMTFVVRLRIEVMPEHAAVNVDGKAVPTSERHALLLDLGTHQIVASAPGYESAVRTVEWPPGSEVAYPLELTPSRERAAVGRAPAASPAHPEERSFGTFKYVALGLTIGAGALTGASVALREDRARALERNCDGFAPQSASRCASWSDDGKAWRRTAIAAGSIGATLAATTIVLFAIDARKSHPSGALRSCALSFDSVHCRVHF